jgi:formamidopyrimidine-DNA glycosylase
VLTIGAGAVRTLGPDLLADETEPSTLVARLRRVDQSRLVGLVLVDQRVVAGIGNMWLAEALWHVQASPFATLAEVDDAALERTLSWARSEMRASVARSRPPRAVYKRAGRGCVRCGEVIVSRGLGDLNRTAYWCPRCQG